MRGRRNVPPPAVHTHAHTNVFLFSFCNTTNKPDSFERGQRIPKKKSQLGLGRLRTTTPFPLRQLPQNLLLLQQRRVPHRDVVQRALRGVLPGVKQDVLGALDRKLVLVRDGVCEIAAPPHQALVVGEGPGDEVGVPGLLAAKVPRGQAELPGDAVPNNFWQPAGQGRGRERERVCRSSVISVSFVVVGRVGAFLTSGAFPGPRRGRRRPP